MYKTLLSTLLYFFIELKNILPLKAHLVLLFGKILGLNFFQDFFEIEHAFRNPCFSVRAGSSGDIFNKQRKKIQQK